MLPAIDKNKGKKGSRLSLAKEREPASPEILVEPGKHE